jgi:hypothetical protein
VIVALLDPVTMTLKHWHRLLEGEVLATETRVEWAVMIRRTFGFEAQVCPGLLIAA